MAARSGATRWPEVARRPEVALRPAMAWERDKNGLRLRDSVSSSVRERERDIEGGFPWGFFLKWVGIVLHFFRPMGTPSPLGSCDPGASMLLHSAPTAFLPCWRRGLSTPMALRSVGSCIPACKNAILTTMPKILISVNENSGHYRALYKFAWIWPRSWTILEPWEHVCFVISEASRSVGMHWGFVFEVLIRRQLIIYSCFSLHKSLNQCFCGFIFRPSSLVMLKLRLQESPLQEWLMQLSRRLWVLFFSRLCSTAHWV